MRSAWKWDALMKFDRHTLITACLAALGSFLLPCLHAQSPRNALGLAEQPPMGWNSWDSYGLTINEQQFRDNIDVLATELKPFGWQYAVIDEGWFLRHPDVRLTPQTLDYELDATGRYIPVPDRFPSAMNQGKNEGFIALGNYVHSRGLKFGIHIVRGIPRKSVERNLPVANSGFHAQDVADTSDACPWDPTNWGVRDTPAGQAWYDALLAQYATWGVDYLKVDCIADHPYKPAEIRMIHRSILKTGRPILLSLSPGPTSPGIAKEIIPYAQMWRVSDDIWDYWTNTRPFPRSVRSQFELAAAWAPYAGPGKWPDDDMLPLGYLGPHPGNGEARPSNLTFDEQKTTMTLWSIARSPLILGANLTNLDENAKKLVTNRDIIDLDQNGHDQRQVSSEDNIIVWTSEGKDNIRYLALFNLNDEPRKIARSYAFYNLPEKTFHAHELWSQKDYGVSTGLDLTLPPHACVLLSLIGEGH
jgi:alpha-galactosidase